MVEQHLSAILYFVRLQLPLLCVREFERFASLRVLVQMARSRAGKARSRTARLAKRARKLGEKKSESTNEDSGDDSLQGDLSKRSATNLPPQEVTQDQEVEEGTIESEKMAAVKESDENVVQGESDAELPVAEAGSNEERGERSVNETQWKSKQDKGNSSTAKKTARYQTQTEKNLSGNESECGSRTTDEQDANGKSVDENPSDTRKDGKKVSLQKKKAHSRAKTSDDVNENESDTLDDDQISDSPESTQADSNDKLADELMNHEETLEKKKTNSKTKTIYDVSDKKSDVLDDKEVSDSRKEVINQAMSSDDVGDNEGDEIGDISKSTQGDKTVRISSHKRRKRRGQPQPVQTSDDEENSDDDGPPDVRNLKSLKATAVLRSNKVTKQGKSLARESKQRQSTSPLNMPPSENESEREEIEEDHTRNKWTSLEQRTKKRKSRQELRSEEEGDLSENLSESTGIVVKRKTTSRRYGKRMKSSESESRDSSEEEKEKISRGKTELINRNSRTRREEAAEDVRDDNECSGSSVSAENTENPQNELIELIISRLPGVQVDIPSTLAIPAAVISLRDLRDRLIKLHESELSLLVNQVEISVHLGKDFLDRMCDTSRVSKNTVKSKVRALSVS